MSKLKKRTKVQQALLVRVAKRIFRDKSKFDMDSFHSPCGTTHCLAGWAFTLTKIGPQTDLELYGDSVDVLGGQLLGEEAKLYFYSNNTDTLAFLKEVLNDT